MTAPSSVWFTSNTSRLSCSNGSSEPLPRVVTPAQAQSATHRTRMTVLATTMYMFSDFLQSLGYVFLTLASIGIAYTFLGAALVRRFASEVPKSGTHCPAITLLKPLHGAEPSLYDNLIS